MLATPKITETPTQLVACLHLIIPHDEIRSVMGPGVNELMSAIATQGVAATGPWFTHHFAVPADTWNFEICVPVSVPIVASGRVEPGHMPAMKAARAVYHGPYEGVANAWVELLSWIKGKGQTAAPDLYECYVVGPALSPDAADWRTELTKPLMS